MLLGYLDEAGNIGVYDPTDLSSTPVFVLAGISVNEGVADDLLMEYVRLKARFEPSLRARQLSEVIRYEVKGASLRRDVRNPSSRDTRRRSLGYLDHVLALLETFGGRIFGRVLIKQAGEVYPGSSTYPSAVAELAATFDRHAITTGQQGLLILDAQTKVKNEGNVHTITTRRYRRGGNVYPSLIESPVFGHSDTHALLQLADLLASALVYPCAVAAYLPARAGDAHLDPAYQLVRTAFGVRLAALEHRYTNPNGDRRGGFRVIDRTSATSSRLLFHD